MNLIKGAPCSTKLNSIGLKFTFYSPMVLRILRQFYLSYMHVYIPILGQFTPAYPCVTFVSHCCVTYYQGEVITSDA